MGSITVSNLGMGFHCELTGRHNAFMAGQPFGYSVDFQRRRKWGLTPFHVGRLDLLPKIFGKVHVAEAVIGLKWCLTPFHATPFHP